MIRRRCLALSGLLTLPAVLGCGAYPPPPPVEPVASSVEAAARAPVAAPVPETTEQRCARMAGMPHQIEPPAKLAGDPAVLTPEAASTGIRDAVSVECLVSVRGRAMHCQMPPGVPPSLEASLRAALDTWRFRPATYDRVPIGRREALNVPLIAPPPGWTPPAPPQGTITQPFGQGMTAPKLITGPSQPTYTREAIDHCIEGKVIARCTITLEGELTDCDIAQSVPYMDQVVLSTLAQQRYTPVMYQGLPQRVFYTLTFRFKLR